MGQSSRGAGYCIPLAGPPLVEAKPLYGSGSVLGPVVLRGQALRHRLRRLEPRRHRGIRPGHYLVVPDVQHPQPALLPEREPDEAAKLDKFRLAEVLPHPVPELIGRRQMPGDRLGIGERGLFPVAVARRGLEVQQLVVLAFGQAGGRGGDRAPVAAVLALDRAGDVDPAQLLELVVTHAVAEDVVPRPGEEPETGGDVCADRGAFRPRRALARAPVHLGAHLVVHLRRGHVADALVVRHRALLLPWPRPVSEHATGPGPPAPLLSVILRTKRSPFALVLVGPRQLTAEPHVPRRARF